MQKNYHSINFSRKKVSFADVQLNEKIKKVRKEAKLTQSQLAERCGLSLAAIQSYELNRANPSLVVLQKIAVACGYRTFDVAFVK